MNFDNFYFNEEPNASSYERCNPKNLKININDNDNDNRDDNRDVNNINNKNEKNIKEIFKTTNDNKKSSKIGFLYEDNNNNNNSSIIGLGIPLWVEITIFSIIGITGIVGIVFLVKYINDKKLNKEINNHSFRNKYNSYTNTNYNKNKLF